MPPFLHPPIEGGELMPDNVQEFMWWAMNAAILVAVWFARNELKEIKEQLKTSNNRHDDHEKRITRLEVRCNLQHGTDDHPLRRVTDFALDPEH